MGSLAWVFILVLSPALSVSRNVTSRSELHLLPNVSLIGSCRSLKGNFQIQGTLRIEICHLLA